MPDKRTFRAGATWSDVDEALARLCEIEADRAARLAAMNQRLAETRALFQDGLDELADEDARLRAEVEQFAREHAADFTPKKSVERLHAVLSFRTTPRAVKELRRPWTDEERMSRVRTSLGSDCIRTIEDIARDVVLAKASAGTITNEDLAAAGLRIGQREQFDIALKHEGAGVDFGAQA